MRAPTERAWERVLTRYFSAHNVPLKWDGLHKRFTGIAGHNFARINPYNEESAWARMPNRFSARETGSDNTVIFVTNRKYGDSVDDSFVVLRLGTFLPMLKALVDTDKERWRDAAHD